MAITKNHYYISKRLLEYGANIDDLSSNVIFSTINTSSHLLELLLDYGLNVNYSLENGLTILMMAVSKGKPDKVKMLVKRGSDINYIDREHQNALFYLNNTDRIDERKKIIYTLIGAGINLNQKDIRGEDIFSIISYQPSPIEEKTLFFIKQAMRKQKIKQIL